MESQFKFVEFSKIAKELSFKALNQLRQLVLDIPNNMELLSDSTHYERVDKLVLWNSDDKAMQIRLHVYANQPCSGKIHNLADISEAHNHRWSFSTRILSGGYFHTIYRMDSLETGKYHLDPIMIRHEGVGSCYALHHSQYHSIIEEPNTVSLIVRGPIEKSSFQVIAENEGEIQPKDSLALQKPEEKKLKTMTLAQYEKALNHLLFLKII
ncbi:MAG TPA: hypothetical protein PKW79_05080 [Rhabdochlamydiaceae bacterium]|nr:hypothetical protein [Rhabdochlamydiaceae bacterium]